MLIDTNIWLALKMENHVHLDVVNKWYESLNPKDTLFFCRATQKGFLRIITNVKMQPDKSSVPMPTNRQAWVIYDSFFATGRVKFVHEPLDLDSKWRMLCSPDSSSTKLWTDAYLAAFAITLNCPFVTLDQGFQQFPQLQLHLLAPSQ